MNITIPTIFAVLLIGQPLSESAPFPPSKSPAEYIVNFVADEDIVWFGEVVHASASRNDTGETVIQWLCRYRELAEPVDVRAFAEAGVNKREQPVIRVRSGGVETYFVTTLRSPDISLDQANKLVTDTEDSPHYSLRQAKTVSVGSFGGKMAVFIGGGVGGILGSIKLEYVE